MRTLLLSALALFCAAVPLQAPAGEAQRRAADRALRAKMLEALPAQTKKLDGAYAQTLAGLARELLNKGALAEALETVKLLEAAAPEHPSAAELKALAGAAAEKENRPLAATALADHQRALAKAATVRAQGHIDLAQAYWNAGLATQAYDLVQTALLIDPELASARALLGQVKVKEAWHGPHAAAQVKAGRVQLPGMGWVDASALERVKKGEWLEAGRWQPLENADIAHLDPVNPWTIEGEHVVLKAAVHRRTAVATAERLEQFRAVVYREMLPFFRRSERGAKMHFQHAHKPKLQVLCFAERPDYEALVRREFKPPLEQFLLLLPGFYHNQKKTLFFDAGSDDEFRRFFIQHEFTRQILAEYAGSGGGAGGIGLPPWLNNAATQSLLFARPGENGAWYLPARFGHPQVQRAVEMQDRGTLTPLAALFEMDEKAFDNPVGGEERKAVCGAFGRFCLEGLNGIYALDFCELLHDAQRSPRSVNPADYYGDLKELENQFLLYLRR